MSRSPSSVALGLVQLVIGLLIFVPSGLCTSWGLYGVLGSNGLEMLPLVLGIGAPFLIGGFLLIRAGIRRFREPPPD